MTYTVKELAKLSGVSIRTLHFYHEIGLLIPARVGENGYRYYEAEELLQLQQILFYRELGFPLEEIQQILGSSDFDKVAALTSHRKMLVQANQRTKALIHTIDQTIASLQGGKSMKANELYLGFDPVKQAEYEKYWTSKGGEEAQRMIQESKGNTKGWKKSDYDSVAVEFENLDRKMTEELKQGEPASSPKVQAVVRSHYQLIQKFFQPNRTVYAGLGQMYTEHPDFRARYDAHHPRLAEYWANAMKCFADAELSD